MFHAQGETPKGAVVRSSALTLFVARVIADHHDLAVATNHLAVVTDLLDAWLNFHCGSFAAQGS